VFGPGGERLNKGIAYNGKMSASFRVTDVPTPKQDMAARKQRREKAMLKSKNLQAKVLPHSDIDGGSSSGTDTRRASSLTKEKSARRRTNRGSHEDLNQQIEYVTMQDNTLTLLFNPMSQLHILGKVREGEGEGCMRIYYVG
jgi:CTP-dependent riboflavin kinase